MNQADLLRAHLEAETEGSRSPVIDEAIARYEEVWLKGRFAQLMALTPQKLKEMSQVERRNLYAAATNFIKRLETQKSLLERNTRLIDLELPDAWRKEA